MDPATRAAFERVTDLYSEESFTARIAELRTQFGDLLDEEALALFVLDEHGRNAGAVVAVRDCRGRAEATVDVVVERALEVREFARGEGAGRVQNVLVRCAAHGDEARLTLWDRDVEKVADLKPGARVRVVNARVKDSRFGIELHVSAWTRLEIEGALDPARLKLLTDTLEDAGSSASPAAQPATGARASRQSTLFDDAPAPRGGAGGLPIEPAPARAAAREGGAVEPEPLALARPGDTLHFARFRLKGLRPTRPFRRSDGTTGFVAEADVEDAGVAATLVCWDDAVKALRALAPGAWVEATDLVVKEKSGRLELSTTRATRLALANPKP